MARDLQNEKDHHKMSVDFHGMRFHFNRDHAPSHWSAQQMESDQYINQFGEYQNHQTQSANPSLPEIAYYGVPLLLFAVSIFIMMCLLGTCCGCISAHYLSQKKKREQKQMEEILEYKIIPNEDGDAE